MKRKKCKIIIGSLLIFIVFFPSCKQERYRFAIYEYKVNGIIYSVKIDDVKDLKIIKKGISSLKQENIIFRRLYDLKIGLENGDTLNYVGNGYIMEDSTRSYYMPRGKARNDYMKFLNENAKGLEIDEVAGDH